MNISSTGFRNWGIFKIMRQFSIYSPAGEQEADVFSFGVERIIANNADAQIYVAGLSLKRDNPTLNFIEFKYRSSNNQTSSMNLRRIPLFAMRLVAIDHKSRLKTKLTNFTNIRYSGGCENGF